MTRERMETAAFLALSLTLCPAAGLAQKAGPQAALAGKDGLEHVRVPPGSFQMGCVPEDQECDEREKPRHAATITKGFWLGRTEVTVAAYRRFATATGRKMAAAPDFNPGWRFGSHPMVRVSWHDAAAYCAWAGGRLPTEAEWEYAARAGGGSTKYPWGDTVGRAQANYGSDQCCRGMASGPDRWLSTSPVGSFPPNALGLVDMSGNVWEWCADEYRADAYRQPAGGPPAAAPEHVLRGGSWSSDPWLLRLSYRLGSDPGSDANYGAGFRCARDVAP